MTLPASLARRSRPSRKALASILVSSALVVSVAACSPITTTLPYAASDGIRTSVGELSIINFMVIADEAGTTGRVLAAITNTGSAATDLVLTLPAEGGRSTTFPVEAGATLNLNLDENATTVKNLGAKPGSVVQATIATSSAAGDLTVAVPVLDGTLPEYADYVPTQD